MIEAKQVTKVFGLRPVLRGIDLTVGAGEFVTLFGPNGSGKTTFLRILATLSKQTTGLVKLAGLQVPQQSGAVRRSLGMVSHHPMLYGDLSAEENLLLFARLYNLDDGEAVAAAALAEVGLAPRARDLVRTFSRGMLQRLTIARALLHSPSILLLDEPYTGLDQDAAAMLDKVLRGALEANSHLAVIMTTHNITRGLALCDRAAILSRGKIAHDASRASLGSELDFAGLYAETTGAATTQ